jgi:serine/threonine protein kinase
VASKKVNLLQHYESVRPSSFVSTLSKLCAPPLGSDGCAIGTGGSSTVTLEEDPRTGTLVAVKHIAVSREKEDLVRELVALATLNHPNVLRIIGWTFRDRSHSAEIQTEYAPNGSLAQLLWKLGQGQICPLFWTPTGIGIIICGIVLGMRYIHGRGIIHGDLKPGNILLNEKGHPLIADFGSSRFQSDHATPLPDTGTVRYAAPERFSEGAVLTSKIDVFSFGLILYELVVGSPVFPPSDSQFDVIRRLRARALPAVPPRYGPLMQDLIGRCCETDPDSRPSFQDILDLFRREEFQILLNAVPSDIRDFCDAILEWEVRSGIRQ